MVEIEVLKMIIWIILISFLFLFNRILSLFFLVEFCLRFRDSCRVFFGEDRVCCVRGRFFVQVRGRFYLLVNVCIFVFVKVFLCYRNSIGVSIRQKQERRFFNGKNLFGFLAKVFWMWLIDTSLFCLESYFILFGYMFIFWSRIFGGCGWCDG